MMPKGSTGPRAVAAALVAVLAGCVSDRAVIDQANDAHTSIEAAVFTDPEITAYMQALGDRIVSVAHDLDREGKGPESHFKDGEGNEWMFTRGRFHLVNSKTLNAFTTGAEHMYIYSELMQHCRTEDELAAVMAHEFAHVYGRHVHKGMSRQLGVIAGAIVLGGAGYAIGGKEHGSDYAQIGAGAGLVAGQLVGMSFTRQDEAEADEWGHEFYARAGWDPARFGDFFQQMVDMGLDTTPEVVSDHPSLASRVETAKKRAQEFPPEAKSWRRSPFADDYEFSRIKLRVAALGQTMPGDDHLKKAQALLGAVPFCMLAGRQAAQP